MKAAIMQSGGTSSYVNMGLMNIGHQAYGVRELIQGLFNNMKWWGHEPYQTV